MKMETSSNPVPPCPVCGAGRLLQISESNALLVEGPSDEDICQSLMNRIGVAGIQIIPLHGKENLPRYLSRIGFPPNIYPDEKVVERLGILLDADDDPDKAEKDVKKSLKKAKFPVPDSPLEAKSDGTRTVMFLVVPSGGGAMEDMCLESVQDHAGMRLTEDFFDNVDKCRCLPKQTPAKRAKAKAQVFLSTRENPDTRNLGIAAKRGVWNFDHPVWDSLKKFLRLIEGNSVP